MADNPYPFLKLDKDQVLFTYPHGEVIIPDSYIQHGIAEIIGQEVETFGLFYFHVWDTYEFENKKPVSYLYKFPSKIRLCPSTIVDRRNENKEKEYVLTFTENDAFIKTTLIPKSSSVSSAMIDILFKGYLPEHIKYSEIHDLWVQCDKINAVDLKVSESIRELIIGELARSRADLSQPFRSVLAKDPTHNLLDYKTVQIVSLPRYNSAFASLTSADAKHGITVSAVRKRRGQKDKVSPVEEAIR